MFVVKINQMKKKIIILFVSITLTLSTVYASSKKDRVPESVSSVFNRDFANASNVNWEILNGYYKASFYEHGIVLFAFYTEKADFMGIAKNIISDQLPASLYAKLKKNCSGYWIADLFKSYVNDTPGYFVALENANEKIMLKAERNQSWEFYSEVRKD